MWILFLSALLLTFQQTLATQSHLQSQSETKLCDRNRFEYFSTYILGRQQDLTETFKKLENTTVVPEIVYKDQVYRTYTIKNFKVHFYFAESKQKVEIFQVNKVRVSGGTLKISYTFDWQKKQLGDSINGTGQGSVTSDPILFEKQLDKTKDHILVWALIKLDPVAISNSLTLSKIAPYKKPDFDVITEMLNSLKNNHTTVKIELIAAVNKNIQPTLAEIVTHDQTWTIDRVIDYSYNDYRGEFTVSFDNLLQNALLANQGLSLEISQTIQNYDKFECGDDVPNLPDDTKVFGGHQEFISNSLLKSTLQFAIQRGFLDVVLTEENWQSRAFQFYMGDVHQVIPATKNISSYQKINGTCKALNDQAFKFQKKNDNTYQINVNFTCSFTFQSPSKKLFGMNLLISYEVKPKLNQKSLDFMVSAISGQPTFIEEPAYRIIEKELALFMITETINTARGTNVIGSGYRTSNRKVPNLAVRNSFLMLYDASTKGQRKFGLQQE